jgi:hypothetical protein
VRGDFPLAARALDVVSQYDELAEVARGGSPIAASFASMKTVLHEWGVIADARLMRPLRSLEPGEAAELRSRLAKLPHGAQRLAVAV